MWYPSHVVPVPHATVSKTLRWHNGRDQPVTKPPAVG